MFHRSEKSWHTVAYRGIPWRSPNLDIKLVQFFIHSPSDVALHPQKTLAGPILWSNFCDPHSAQLSRLEVSKIHPAHPDFRRIWAPFSFRSIACSTGPRLTPVSSPIENASVELTEMVGDVLADITGMNGRRWHGRPVPPVRFRTPSDAAPVSALRPTLVDRMVERGHFTAQTTQQTN